MSDKLQDISAIELINIGGTVTRHVSVGHAPVPHRGPLTSPDSHHPDEPDDPPPGSGRGGHDNKNWLIKSSDTGGVALNKLATLALQQQKFLKKVFKQN